MALDGRSVGVVDTTSTHLRTLYEVYERVVERECYLKRPRSVLEWPPAVGQTRRARPSLAADSRGPSVPAGRRGAED